MGIIDRIRAKYRWTFIGSATGECRFYRDGAYTGVVDHTIWNLYVRGDGKRSFKVHGDMSEFSKTAHKVAVKAQVSAWKSGGPLPKEFVPAAQPTPPKKAKLIAFPGGKGAA